MIAVFSYLLCVIPLVGIALVDLGLIRRPDTHRGSEKMRAIFIGLFLVIAHVAMIFGMLDPTVF
jgi:hypothetical protein